MSTNTVFGNGFQQADLASSSDNVIMGYKAGAKLTNNNNNNVLIGPDSGLHVRNNLQSNVFIGSGVATSPSVSNLTGNSIIGSSAGTSLTNGSDNTILGYQAGRNITTGDNSIAIGYGALGGGVGTVDDDEHIVIGTFAGNSLSSGSYGNILLGLNAGFNIIGGSQNLCMGDLAMYNSNGNRNIGFGANVLYNVTGTDNIAMGNNAGIGIVAGGYNIALGTESMNNAGTIAGFYNIAMGYNTLRQLTSGESNIGIGASVMGLLTAGQQNIAIGDTAGGSIFTGSANIAIGRGSLRNGAPTIVGSRNIAIGASSNFAILSSGNDNISMGQDAGTSISTGSNNIAIGNTSMGDVANLTGSNNTAVGNLAGRILFGAATGNTFIGNQAGTNMTSGSNNVCIGTQSGNAGTGSNNIFIGNTAGNATAANSSNQLIVRQNATTLISGDFSTGSVTIASVQFSSNNVTSNSILLQTTGGTPTALNYYEEFSLVEPVSEFISPVNVTMTLTRVGRNVTLTISSVTPQAISGANRPIIGSANSFPARFRPQASSQFSINFTTGSAVNTGLLSWDPNTFGPGLGAWFIATATNNNPTTSCGWGNINVSYNV